MVTIVGSGCTALFNRILVRQVTSKLRFLSSLLFLCHRKACLQYHVINSYVVQYFEYSLAKAAFIFRFLQNNLKGMLNIPCEYLYSVRSLQDMSCLNDSSNDGQKEEEDRQKGLFY